MSASEPLFRRNLSGNVAQFRFSFTLLHFMCQHKRGERFCIRTAAAIRFSGRAYLCLARPERQILPRMKALDVLRDNDFHLSMFFGKVIAFNSGKAEGSSFFPARSTGLCRHIPPRQEVVDGISRSWSEREFPSGPGDGVAALCGGHVDANPWECYENTK